jgi:parallel beta-helix repeat protein
MNRPKLTALVLALALGALAAVAPEALATHVTCGDTITTDTKLDSDLINCPGDGIVIGADNMTLDLAGHSVSGTGVGIGIRNGSFYPGDRGHDSVTIENGEVARFLIGVSLGAPITFADTGTSTVENNAVERLHLTENHSTALMLHEANHNRVRRNVIAGTAFNAIDMTNASSNRIEHNELTDNWGGISLPSSITGGEADNVIQANVLSNSGGISLDRNTFGTVVTRNIINDSASSGIGISKSNGGWIFKNYISNSRGPGIMIEPSGSSVVENVIVGSGGAGIESSYSGPIRGNVVSGNRGSGIAASGGLDLRGNIAVANAVDGISILGFAEGTIEKNVARANGDDGIDADSEFAAVLLAKNAAYYNGDFGIEADPGVIDGGGNKASGNGNPLQCLNVFCK